MTQDTKLDWGAAIEAVSDLGKIVSADWCWRDEAEKANGIRFVSVPGYFGWPFSEAGNPLHGHQLRWTIRNRAMPDTVSQAEPLDYPTYVPTTTNEVRERMEGRFKRGDRVEKVSGSSWTGTVVGEYSTSLTPEGYAVESENEPGSVQIYPAKALRALLDPVDGDEAEIQKLLADFRALGSSMTKGQRARSLASAALARGRALAEAGKNTVIATGAPCNPPREA